MEDSNQKTNETTQNEINCVSCGANLKYSPGTTMLSCEYCGAENQIEKHDVEIIENSYLDIIHKLENDEKNLTEEILVNCDSCGAQTTFDSQRISDDCEFCGSPIVVKEGHPEKVLKPEYILPFKIKQKEAFGSFSKWVTSRWFAPNDFKEYANRAEKLSGIYLPYWTFDAQTDTSYVGERGTKHTRRDSDGKTSTYVSWVTVRGYVHNFFDDIVIVASKSLPIDKTAALEPWDLENLEAYNDKYLTGFKAEHYSIGLESGFDVAKGKMEEHIRSLIRRDIGGDKQRITKMSTMHQEIKFKHLLLPIWISAYKYNGKSYRIMINGRTGEVQGERPYSAIKISLFILMIISLILLFTYHQDLLSYFLTTNTK